MYAISSCGRSRYIARPTLVGALIGLHVLICMSIYPANTGARCGLNGLGYITNTTHRLLGVLLWLRGIPNDNVSRWFTPFVLRGNPRWPMDSPHKGPATRKMFPFDNVVRSNINFGSFLDKKFGDFMNFFGALIKLIVLLEVCHIKICLW